MSEWQVTADDLESIKAANWARIELELGAIQHRKLDLTGLEDDPREWDCDRPEISVWTETCEDTKGGTCVSVSIGPLWGQSARFLSLMPIEARKLAQMLVDVADAHDRVIGLISD